MLAKRYGTDEAEILEFEYQKEGVLVVKIRPRKPSDDAIDGAYRYWAPIFAMTEPHLTITGVALFGIGARGEADFNHSMLFRVVNPDQWCNYLDMPCNGGK